jgi:cytochrome b-561 domain-containing protein 2
MGARSTKVRWHWVLQGCAVLTSFTGFITITANKIIKGSNHYTTYHGLLGLFLTGLVFIQTSGGIAVMYPGILPFKVRLVTLKRMHAFFGTLTYFGGLVILVLGVYSSWFSANADPIMWKVCLVCPILLGCAVLLQMFRNYIWRW